MSPAARDILNMRIRAKDRALFDRAAKALGKSRADFILEAARRAAEEVVLDRTVVQVNAKAFTDFVARLEGPPLPNQRFKRTMQRKAPWE
jgi:uncharacterized protein (DUF1778 family)